MLWSFIDNFVPAKTHISFYLMNIIHDHRPPSLLASLLPIAVLIAGLISIITFYGAGAVQDMSHYILLTAAAIAASISVFYYRRPLRAMRTGLLKSAIQVLPTIPILLMIATVAATWMLSGVVPTLVCYGLEILNPSAFLVTTCAVCAIISVLSGSSWTTIATIGVAFMGIGSVWGYNPAWIAGAIISGAYFGDKVSPLSDTTVLASSTCDVGLFTHIRYLMWTSLPAMLLAMTVFAIAGMMSDHGSATQSSLMLTHLHETFNITPWCMIIPLATIGLILLRLNTAVTLGLGSLLGIAGIVLWQPHILASLSGTGSIYDMAIAVVRLLVTETSLSTGDPALDALVTTGGMKGMLPTIYLILSAMIFGGVLMGSGMLSRITHSITKRINSSRTTVTTTVATGLMLNGCTGDQYLSIILNGNLYRNLYRRNGLEPRLLSRSIEDSTSVTSVLIPWNSCGLTQSAVLGVATLTYLPYCIFNIASPLVSIATAWIGFRIRRVMKQAVA